VISFSKEEALRLGHDFIGTEHLMLGLLRDGQGKAVEILNALDIDLSQLRRKVEILSPANPNISTATNKKKKLTPNKAGRTRPQNNFFRSQALSK
jgi:ATP-dependent Clp protease ATP-binding subunit ClpC